MRRRGILEGVGVGVEVAWLNELLKLMRLVRCGGIEERWGCPQPNQLAHDRPGYPAAATAQVETQAAKVKQATAEAQATQDAQATLNAQATANACATGTVVAGQTATRQAINVTTTAVKKAWLTQTAQAIAQKTAQAQPMFDQVQKLFTDGYLAGADGTYAHLADFDKSLAMINYIDYFPTSYSPTNFVLRVDMTWDTVSGADKWSSGCGFVFHLGADNSYYAAYLTLDGNVVVLNYTTKMRYLNRIGQGYYGKVDYPKGKASMVLIVRNDKGITIFINDKRVLRTGVELDLKEGYLAYSLVSGSNKDYGTRCQWNNVDLWELK